MALIFCDGCDGTGDTALKWRSQFNSAYITTGGAVNGGGYITVYSNGNAEWYPTSAPAVTDRLLIGFWLSTGASKTFFLIKNFDNNQGAYISTDSAGRIIVQQWVSPTNSGATAVTSTTAVGDGAWHWIDLDITYANSGSVKIYIDGVLDTNNTSVDTLGSGTPAVARLQLGALNNFDDIIWYNNDAGMLTGSDFPLTPMKIETLRPTSDITNDFTLSTGTTAYTLLDDVTPSMTDYAESSTSAHVCRMGYGNMTTTPASIKGVVVNTFAVNPGTASISMQAQVKSGATTSDATAQTLTTTTRTYQTPFATDPNTASAWTKSGVDGAEIGVKVA